jgi:anti-sigma B factor antagonist
MVGEASPQGGFRVTRRKSSDETLTLEVGGELDITASPHLREALDEAVDASPGDLELDLGGCSFIDSTGLQVIVQAGIALAEKGRSLALSRPREHVRRLFLTAGIDRIEGLRVVSDAPHTSGS